MEKVKTSHQAVITECVVNFGIELIKYSAFRDWRRWGEKKADVHEEKL